MIANDDEMFVREKFSLQDVLLESISVPSRKRVSVPFDFMSMFILHKSSFFEMVTQGLIVIAIFRFTKAIPFFQGFFTHFSILNFQSNLNKHRKSNRFF